MDNPWATDDQDWPPAKWPEPRQSELVWAQDTSSEQDPSDTTPETTASSISDGEKLIDPPEDSWTVPWGSTPSETDPKSPDHWETARLEKEKRNCAVPPELLDSLLRHCQQVSQEIWLTPENNGQDDWRSGFDDHADIAALLAQLLPNDTSLPSLQFSDTATAKAMSEALKLTRHLPTTASSPLSRLLASKGSLEWEKSIKTKTKQEIVSDAPHVGWRVLEKEDRLNTAEESKPRKATGGLLSFWNRRASAIPAPPAETPSERSSSLVRSSLDAIKSLPYPSSPAVSPSNAPSPPIPPTTDAPTVVIATAPAASAVSRFLNRFSLARGPQHTSLALSADDLEFLSDVVPSASDPPDEDVGHSPLGMLMGASNSSPLPPKLPPPIPPPPKQPLSSSRPPSVLGFEALNGESGVGSAPTATQNANHTPNVPALAPPLSPRLAAPFLHTMSPPLSFKEIPTATSGLSSAPPSTQQRSLSGSQSSFKLSLPYKSPPLLSIPPLLPPPPVSPPQTPRPSAFPSMTLGRSPTKDSSSSHYDSDDEFSAFASYPPASFPSSKPVQEPPSPPPRHTYERTHYPSSSSASSILSPASQTSLEQLCIVEPSTSASLDSFDDFVSSSPVVRVEKRTPSPPPLPIKSQFQHPQPSRINTLTSRIHNPYSPSQNVASPTIHTNLLNGPFSIPSVSDTERRRTQNLVDQAAACGGVLWPNSPVSDEPRVQAIPPPPSTSPKPASGQAHIDLLGDGDTLESGLELVGVGMGPTATPAKDAWRMPLAHGVGKGLGAKNQVQPSPPPPTSTSMFSLGTSVPFVAPTPGLLQPMKPKQTGGLSAQDLSFFEGL